MTNINSSSSAWVAPLTIALLVSLSYAAQAETLDDALRLAVETDQRLQAEQQRGAAADEQLATARAAHWPTITLDGAYYHLDSTPSATVSIAPLPALKMELAPDESAMYGATGTLPLFTSGRIHYGIRAAQAAVNAEHEQINATAQDIKLQTAEAYINVLRAQRLLTLAESSVATLTVHARDANALYEKGLVARNDALAADVALANTRQDRLRAQHMLDLARAAYNRATGRALDEAVNIDEVQTPSTGDTLDSYTQRALLKRPELAALSQQTSALQAQARSTRAEQLPVVSLSGGRYYLNNPLLTDDAFWSVSVNLRWTVFDGGQIAGRAHNLERQADVSTDLRRDAESQIRLQVRQTWLSVDEARQRIDVAAQARAQADENLRVARDRYTSAVGTNTEVLDAETLRVRSEANYANALYDHALAQQQLRRASGDL